MSAFSPIPPRLAIDLVQSAQLGEAGRVLVDFAAAGLVKGYARLIETVDARGTRTEVRDSRIPRNLWRRIVDEGRVEDAWTAGSVRLAGSDLVGGAPAVTVTGIRFDDVSLQATIAQHNLSAGVGRVRRTPVTSVAATDAVLTEPPPTAVAPASLSRASPIAIPEGSVTVTIKQAMAALGLGRTTVDKLCGIGRLTRVKVGGRALITVDSIRTLVAGAG